MKKLIAVALLAAPLSMAGVVKVVTFPVRHPVKTVTATAKGVANRVAYVAKAVYNF